ncbi:hypothetical protein PPUJ20028_41350 [Pseudomonas putida]|uniref:Integrase n=1 Tax=Pseudomonas putida TaxID=303 RepID=A0AA37VT53_PSEPU|nr:hypothetical protein PPUJ20028_41350 [Pseudomonas putida]GLO37082.1 hypothetical protein PPUN14671_39180 [Pseudomonas putida]
MATVSARKKADGAVSYTVRIYLNKTDAVVYQEAQTFARKQAGQAWTKRREIGLVGAGTVSGLGAEAMSRSFV